jgi:HEAT repeat protein
MNHSRFYLFLVLLCFGMAAGTLLHAIQPPPGFNDKTVKELLPLLDSPDIETRKNATAGISWQLEQNEISLTNIEPTVIKATLSKTLSLFEHEENRVVRLGCVAILLNLDAWTNTVQPLTQTTDDKNYFVRVRAITALLDVSRNHHEQLSTNVILRLEDCLKSTNDTEVLWQAAFVAGESGAKELLPLLQNLLQNPSSKVRQYASEAIGKLSH